MERPGAAVGARLPTGGQFRLDDVGLRVEVGQPDKEVLRQVELRFALGPPRVQVGQLAAEADVERDRVFGNGRRLGRVRRAGDKGDLLDEARDDCLLYTSDAADE